jgi:hypothetical protein
MPSRIVTYVHRPSATAAEAEGGRDLGSYRVALGQRPKGRVMTLTYRQFENLRVGDALILPPLRVPPQWHKTPILYRRQVLARLQERERDQGHRCAICKTSEPGGKHGNLNMDHCHDCGFVRSMLCHRCNFVRPDCVADAERLAAYLRFWESMFAFYEAADMQP